MKHLLFIIAVLTVIPFSKAQDLGLAMEASGFYSIPIRGATGKSDRMEETYLKSFRKIYGFQQRYYGASVAAGLNIDYQQKGTLSLLGLYQFSSTWVYFSKYDVKPTIRNHFMGVKLKYTFKSADKIFRPFIAVFSLSEVSSNYTNQLIDGVTFLPRRMSEEGHDSFYKGTPLAAGLSGGVGIRIIPNLQLNISVDYRFQVVNTNYFAWKKEPPMDEVLETMNDTSSSYSVSMFHMLDVSLGITYALPLKRSAKPIHEN